jgi:hypothetical protein
MSTQLGLTFHRTFSLVRPAIGQVVTLAAALNRGEFGNAELTKDLLRENSGLGTIYVEAMPRYARGSGLLDDKNHLTMFGEFASVSDGLLEYPDTQWLMHYFLSADSGSGPLFWHQLCSTHFRVGNRFTRQRITGDIADIYERSAGQPASPSALKSTTTIFLGTYTKFDGLGNLGILYQEGDQYVVTQPDAPSAWAFGYALIDDWERHHAGKLSINLDELTKARGLGSLFLMDESAVNAALSELQRAGVVDLYRSARPYQLLLLTNDREAMLRKVYGVDNS